MDILGTAMTRYYELQDDTPVKTAIDGRSDNEMAPSIFFRDGRRMTKTEKLALQHCKGHVLDIGAGAGAHALQLQKKGIEVTAIDSSEKACVIMAQRGVEEVVYGEIESFKGGKYDTLLLMMNGFGLARTRKNLPSWLKKLKGLLKPGGRIIGETTDIDYMLHEDGVDVDAFLKKDYYGDARFSLKYKGKKQEIEWLYIDPMSLEIAADKAGLKTKILRADGNGGYLVQLTAK